jgi:hypothetical protein
VAIVGYDASGRPIRDDQRQQQSGPVVGYDASGRAIRGQQRMGALAAFGSGVGDAISFGFGDELQGLVFGDEARDAARMRQERARADQGGWFLGGQIAGSLAGGGAANLGLRGAVGATRLASAARNLGPMSRIGIAAATGGAGGALYGAGDATDGNRIQGATDSFLPGAGFGALGQGLFGELMPRVGGAVQRSLSPEARAGRNMAEALDRFGPASSTPQQVEAQVLQALQDAPDNAMVADVVPGFTSLVRGAGVRPSREREALREAFDARNNAMGARAEGDIWNTLGGGLPREAGDVIGALRESQRTQAVPLYAQAYRQRIDGRQAEAATREIIRRNPAIFGPAQEHARAMMLSEFGQEITDTSDPRYWHSLLQGAERELGARLRAGSMGDARGFHGEEIAKYTRAVQVFNTQVRRLLGPEFRRAQDIYSGAARSMDALERGYQAASPNLNSMNLADLTAWMRRARPGELEHMRVGVLNRLTDEIARADTGSGRSDVIRALLRNEGQRRVLTRIFGGERGFNDLIRRLETQRNLFRTSVDTGIGVNSHTADRLAAMNSQQALTQPVTGVRDAVFRLLTRDATDRFDENVSNEILRTAGLNANQVANEIGQAGGFRQWAGGRGLLSRAVRERERMLQQRPNALMGALGMGLYAPTAGAGVGYYGFGQ